MNFGGREDVSDFDEERLVKRIKEFPKAQPCDKDKAATIFLVADDSEKYHEYAVAQVAPPLTRKEFFAKAFAAVRRLA